MKTLYDVLQRAASGDGAALFVCGGGALLLLMLAQTVLLAVLAADARRIATRLRARAPKPTLRERLAAVSRAARAGVTALRAGLPRNRREALRLTTMRKRRPVTTLPSHRPPFPKTRRYY